MHIISLVENKLNSLWDSLSNDPIDLYIYKCILYTYQNAGILMKGIKEKPNYITDPDKLKQFDLNYQMYFESMYLYLHRIEAAIRKKHIEIKNKPEEKEYEEWLRELYLYTKIRNKLIEHPFNNIKFEVNTGLIQGQIIEHRMSFLDVNKINEISRNSQISQPLFTAIDSLNSELNISINEKFPMIFVELIKYSKFINNNEMDVIFSKSVKEIGFVSHSLEEIFITLNKFIKYYYAI